MRVRCKLPDAASNARDVRGRSTRYLTLLLAMGLFSAVFAPCVRASELGPFQGRIVDADTKELIEGVVVLFEWVQIHPYRGGSSFYDAQETVTDHSGEFFIQGIWSLNPLVWIRAEAHVTMFKSGYGTPDYLVSAPYVDGRYEPDRYIAGAKGPFRGTWKGLVEVEWGAKKGSFIWKHEGDMPVFMLKKLSTRDERRQSIPSEPILPSEEYHRNKEKWKLLKQEIEKEEKILEQMKRPVKRWRGKS